MVIKAKIIDSDDEYLQAVQLRELVLRKPLGLKISPEEASFEKRHLNFGIFDGAEILATASLVPEGKSCKMQRVAVRPDKQNHGYGGELVRFIEKEALKTGNLSIYCHARDTAEKFYKAHGYVAMGEHFLEVGIGHIKMMKPLGLSLDAASKEERESIGQRIDDFNVAQTKCKSLQDEISYVLKAEGQIIAGIESWLYFDQVLYISVIFVDEKFRHQRLGSYLLSKVEQEASARGAKLIHLDTFDFQAQEFYLKHGYELFGVLDGCPPGHKRYYLKKVIR